MAAPEILPTSTIKAGGQTAIDGWQILDETEGWEDVTNTYKNTNGTFRADLTTSRRKTLQLELQENFTAPAIMTEAVLLLPVSFTWNAVAYRIRSVAIKRTEGPVMATVGLIALVDSVS